MPTTTRKTATTVRSEDVPEYTTSPSATRFTGGAIGWTEEERETVNRALEIVKRRHSALGGDTPIRGANHGARYIRLLCEADPHERFVVAFLDARHRVIAGEVMFKGTIDGASVWARPIVTRCLELNAAAVIIGHNHPSGSPEPSEADERITRSLREALGLVDVKVLDHIVIGAEEHVSFAERGLI